jgi:ABC-type tungstate transport system permease subunit
MTLNTARARMDAYTLTDRGAWLAFQEIKRPDDTRRKRQAIVQSNTSVMLVRSAEEARR